MLEKISDIMMFRRPQLKGIIKHEEPTYGDIVRIGQYKPLKKTNKKNTKKERKVYLFESKGEYKIGVTVDISERIRTLSTGNPSIKHIASNEFKNGYDKEKQM